MEWEVFEHAVLEKIFETEIGNKAVKLRVENTNKNDVKIRHRVLVCGKAEVKFTLICVLSTALHFNTSKNH